MPSADNFTATYAVPLHCDSCVNSVSQALNSLDGVQSVQCDLAKQLVTVYGNLAPSSVVNAMQSIGRDAIVRGTGLPNSAAVCILESFEDNESPVKGLARIVGVSSNKALFDVTLNGLPKGKYYPSVRVGGDLSSGPLSTGPQWLELGEVDVSQELTSSNELLSGQSNGYSGQAVFVKDVTISDIIGRGMTVSRSKSANYPDSLVGVIARSAGVWENAKTVCSCSGKTVWEERTDAVKSGIH